jgi:rubrerythrin
MSDYIKREDAIKKIKGQINNPAIVGWLTRLIISVPAADVAEEKHGQWQLDEDASCGHTEYIYTCSACRNGTAWGETEKTRYCPNCGALMMEG